MSEHLSRSYRFYRISLRILVVVSIFMLISTISFADPPVPGSDDAIAMSPYKSWIEGQHLPNGHWCCDFSDGRPVSACISSKMPTSTRVHLDDGKETERLNCTNDGNEDAHWWAHVTSKHWPGVLDHWIMIPDEKVNHQINPTGLTILWYNKSSDEAYCFSPQGGV